VKRRSYLVARTRKISSLAKGASRFTKYDLSAGGLFQHSAEGRYFMPMYDYKCLDCGKESLVVLTLKQHESNTVTCPKCGSTKVQQLYTSFVAHTTKKS
jgi:putative FmdB family regulatory protein